AEVGTVHYGPGAGSVRLEVTATDSLEAGHEYRLHFIAPSPDSIRATKYALTDSAAEGERLLFTTGNVFDRRTMGVASAGVLPVVSTGLLPEADTKRTALRPGSGTNVRFAVSRIALGDVALSLGRSPNVRRPGYPDDFWIEFDSQVRDTGLRIPP